MTFEDRTKFVFRVPSGYSASSKRRIAREAVRRIRRRTQQGIDKNGQAFKGYSEAYTSSLDFRIGGKSPSNVNLKLSGDMLASIDVLEISGDFITVGINDPQEVPKAHGHITGADGTGRLPVRDFMGLPKGEIERIIKQFPKDREQKRETTERNIIDMITAGNATNFDEAADILGRALVETEDVSFPIDRIDDL